MCRILWWRPISIYNSIIFTFFDNGEWVFQKYFIQSILQEALLFYESTNEIHVTFAHEEQLISQIKTIYFWEMYFFYVMQDEGSSINLQMVKVLTESFL